MSAKLIIATHVLKAVTISSLVHALPFAQKTITLCWRFSQVRKQNISLEIAHLLRHREIRPGPKSLL